MQFDFIDDDTRDHTSLDAEVYAELNAMFDCKDVPPSPAAIPPHPAVILCVVAAISPEGMFISTNLPSCRSIVAKYSRDPDGDENSNLAKLLVSCWRRGEFRKIRCLSEHSFTNSLILAMSYSTAEILRPTPAQTSWEDSDRYT